MQSIALKNGVEMPLLGFGVFRLRKDECGQCVRAAVKTGYRMFDTAAACGDEREVGAALKRAMEDGLVRREELFVTAKLSLQDAGENTAEEAFDMTLKKLQLDYVDLYLIHQPYNDYYGAWRVMERLYRERRVRAIGVSNFSPERLVDLCMNSEIPPMVNQVELHPFYHQDATVRTMRELGVCPQAWAPLCEGLRNIFSNRTLEKIGRKYGKSAAQTALRWNLDREVSAVTRSSDPEHIKEDFDIWDFRLSESDRRSVDQLDLGYSEILDYQNPNIAKMFIRRNSGCGTKRAEEA